MTVLLSTSEELIQQHLQEVCQRLLQVDEDLKAIVQFGSSVYAPELASDVDLLLVTEKQKDWGLYLDCTLDCPFPVDLVPIETNRRPPPDMAAGLRVASRLLYGEWKTIERMVKDVPVPTYDEARELLLNADIYLEMAATESSALRREGHYRTAFNALFDAARLAAMTFLNTEETRWGQLRGQLPSPFEEEFREIITALHVDIFYRRELPFADVEAEYRRWRARVVQFINDLEGG